jgi:hypothetical protein
MDTTSRKPVRAITKLIAVAAVGLCVAVLVCAGCIRPDVGKPIGQCLTTQRWLDASDKPLIGIFADDTGKNRAEMQLLPPLRQALEKDFLPVFLAKVFEAMDVGLRNTEVRCLDDNSAWKADPTRSWELWTKGCFSTKPEKVLTSWPSSLPAGQPNAKVKGLALVDERGRVRGVLMEVKDPWMMEIRPVNSASVWRLDWDKTYSRYFGVRCTREMVETLAR